MKINEIQQTINLMHRKINKTTPKQIIENQIQKIIEMKFQL